KPHVPNYHIMRINPNRFPGYHYAIPRGGLSCNGNIGCFDNKGFFQSDDTRNIKHHNAWSHRFESFAKRSWAVVSQAGNDIDISSPASKRKHPSSLSARESRNPGLG